MRVEIIDGKRSLDFGYCEVFEDKDNFYGIYRDGELLTHRHTWKQATKIASLIQRAFCDGYNKSQEDYDYNERMGESYSYFND